MDGDMTPKQNPLIPPLQSLPGLTNQLAGLSPTKHCPVRGCGGDLEPVYSMISHPHGGGMISHPGGVAYWKCRKCGVELVDP